MERLALRHLRSLLGVIRTLYELRDAEAYRRHLLSSVGQLVPSDITAYLEVNPRSWESALWVAPPNPRLRDHKLIMERHLPSHPVVAYRRRTGDVRALRLSDLIARAELHKLPLYQEHYRPLGVESHLGLAFCVDPPRMKLMGLLRGRPDFSEQERLIADLLRPHMIQGYENALAVSRLKRAQARPDEPVGAGGGETIVLSAEGRVREVAPRALRWLARYFRTGTAGPRRLPDELQRWVTHHGAQFGRDADPLEARTPLVKEDGARRLTIRLIAQDDHSLLLLTERPPTIGAPMLDAPGLTRRELEVLGWVARGKTNAEIGVILGARPRTVAKHLERIFAKLGVETRTAAAAFLLDPAPTRDSPRAPQAR